MPGMKSLTAVSSSHQKAVNKYHLYRLQAVQVAFPTSNPYFKTIAIMRKNVMLTALTSVTRYYLLPLVLVCSFLSSFAGKTIGQVMAGKKITISVTNQQLDKVLKEVSRKTGVKFFYSPELIGTNRLVNAEAKDQELAVFLDHLLTPLEISMEVNQAGHIFLNKAVAASGGKTEERLIYQAAARFRKISGRVLTAEGVGLEGASVLLKGSTRGTTTDKQGGFILEVTDTDSVLVISATGYEIKELPVAGNQEFTITLNTVTNSLNDVIVIGYGTQKKKDLTGSVATISGSDIKSVPATTVSNAIAGRLPGLIGRNTSGEPGYDDASILIRGLSTTGNTAPLIVIDGVPERAGGFSRLDPNDIESFTILKDASAAIYGARAANGVILITTRRGKSGQPTVSYNFNYGLRQPTRLPKMLDAATYAQAINELNTAAGQALTYSETDIQKFRDGSDPLGHPNTNWFKETLEPVTSQYQQNASVTGGGDKVKYFLSIGNQKQDGYYRKGASDYKQYNVRSNIDAQVTDNLKLFLNLAARQESRRSPHHGSETIYRYLVAAKPMALAYLPGTDLPALALGDDVNPVAAATSLAGYQRDERTFLNGDIGFTLNLPSVTKGLSLIGGAYFDQSNSLYKHLYKGFDLFKLESGNPVRQHYGLATGDINQNMSKFSGVTANLRLNYERKIGRHDIGTFVAYEQNKTQYDYLRAYRNNLLSTAIDQIFAGEINSSTQTDGYASQTSRRNYFGRVNYSYADKYLLQFNWRYDGSSNFPPDKRYGFFPGVSLGWRLSKEAFMEKVDFVNDLKVRGSYGLLGNDNVGAFQYLTRYTVTSIYGGVFGGQSPALAQGLITSVLANPNITWESAKTFNGGFDAVLLNNKLSVNVDYFFTKRSNILGPRNTSIPAYLGLLLPDENIREVENKGFEVTASYKFNIGKVNIVAGANLAYNNNRIVYMDEAAGAYPWQQSTGKAVGARLLWESVGIFRSQTEIDKLPHPEGTKPGDLIFRDVDGDGAITGNDRVRQDLTGIPRLTFGLPINVGYKNFSVNMLFQGQARAKQYVYFQSGTIGNFSQEYWDKHWTSSNPNAEGPRLYDRENIPSTSYENTYFFRNADFVRLKSVQINYSFPKSLLKKMPVSALQVYVSGFNLFTIDRLKYLDPESVPNDQDYIGWNTPQTRIFNMGVNVTF